jgi:acylphosphatase
MNPRIALAIGLLLSLSAAATFGADEKPSLRKHWFVSGRVQGVSFRAFTYENATDLKLVGWVRNLTDGRVEIVAQGPPKAIDTLLEKVKKGPPGSRVDNVKESEVDAREKLAEHFQIRDSAKPPK